MYNYWANLKFSFPDHNLHIIGTQGRRGPSTITALTPLILQPLAPDPRCFDKYAERIYGLASTGSQVGRDWFHRQVGGTGPLPPSLPSGINSPYTPPPPPLPPL